MWSQVSGRGHGAAGAQDLSRAGASGPDSTTILMILLRGRRQAKDSRDHSDSYQLRSSWDTSALSLLNQSPNSHLFTPHLAFTLPNSSGPLVTHPQVHDSSFLLYRAAQNAELNPLYLPETQQVILEAHGWHCRHFPPDYRPCDTSRHLRYYRLPTGIIYAQAWPAHFSSKPNTNPRPIQNMARKVSGSKPKSW